MKVLFISPHGLEGASARFRIFQYLPFLERDGIECDVECFISGWSYREIYFNANTLVKVSAVLRGGIQRILLLFRIRKYDAIFMHREGFPFGYPLFEKIASWLNPRTIFDLDDAIFTLNPVQLHPFIRYFKYVKRTECITRYSRAVIVGNQYLKDRLAIHNGDIQVVPTSVDTSKYVIRRRGDACRVIGWIGSATTALSLLQIEDVLLKVKAVCPDVLIKIIGGGNFRFRRLDARYADWSLETEIADIQEFTVGLMPIDENEFSRGKCGFKLIQYMGCGIPGVATNFGANKDIIQNGVTGYLADTPDQWEEFILLLLRNKELREVMGKKGRETVVERYSVAASYPRILKTVKRIAAS